MPRRSSGGRPAPAPATAPSAAPRRAPARNPPQPARRAPPPTPAQGSNGGSLLGAISATIAEGMAFGTGSAIAHRAVEAILGPRTVQHRTVVAEATASPTATTKNGGGSNACCSHSMAFQECLNNNRTDIRKCQLYRDLLSECRRKSGGL